MRGVRFSTRADFASATVLVCGTGVAGRSAVEGLLALGADVLVSATGTAPVDLKPPVRFLGDIDEPPAGVELVVTSPGLSPRHRLLVAAQAAGIEVISELEFAWRVRGEQPALWLQVTGTNGKTTTVRMLESILRAEGLRCMAVGNVGVPIITTVLADLGSPPVRYDVLAVEASSFQLSFSTSIRARSGVVLNLAEDHLDWHGSMADYAAQKAKVWTSDIPVANADDPAVMALAAQAGPGLRTFTCGEPAPGQLGIRGQRVVDRAFADDPGSELVAVSAIRPSGRHNLSNALAAIALARTVGVHDAAIAAGLLSFQPDPHRNQYLRSVAGVDYVDDSKATNPHAAEAALHAYERVVWIAGGQLKGADIAPLVARVSRRLVAAIVLGVDRDVVLAAMARHAPDLPVICIDRADDGVMTDVVGAAASLARAGDTVLLSPAAASKDMFSGYDARGRAFAEAVSALAAAAGDVRS